MVCIHELTMYMAIVKVIMKSSILKALCCLFIALNLALSGCTSTLSGDTYSRDEARRPQTVRQGTIINIRTVTVEGTNSGVGKYGGAAVGGIIGSRVDGGHGAWAALGGVLGAIGGGLAGKGTEELVTRKKMLEITVREDSGRTIAVVQEPGNDSFKIGDHVNILTSNKGVTRISN